MISPSTVLNSSGAFFVDFTGVRIWDEDYRIRLGHRMNKGSANPHDKYAPNYAPAVMVSS